MKLIVNKTQLNNNKYLKYLKKYGKLKLGYDIGNR